MSINGTYVLSSNENYAEWLGEIGIPADAIARLEKAKPTLEVTHSGDSISIKTIAGDKNFTNTIVSGKDSVATLPGGIEYTVNMTISGNKLSGTWTMAGKTGTATVEVSAAGLTQSMTYNNVSAKRIYARQ